MRVAEPRPPRGGRKVERRAVEARPNVVADDGTEYEVVWYPHRDAASLLPADSPAVDLRVGGRIILNSDYRWSWLG